MKISIHRSGGDDGADWAFTLVTPLRSYFKTRRTARVIERILNSRPDSKAVENYFRLIAEKSGGTIKVERS